MMEPNMALWWAHGGPRVGRQLRPAATAGEYGHGMSSASTREEKREREVLVNNTFMSLLGDQKTSAAETCVCVMCVKPQKIWVDFLLEMKRKHNYDMYLIVDDNSVRYQINGITIVQIGDEFCKQVGFMNASPLVKNNEPSVWDKMFLYFSYNNQYKNYWILENDVFVPTIDTIHDIDTKYKEKDILCSGHAVKEDDKVLDWHWQRMKFKGRYAFELPWHSSMVCAIRLTSAFFDQCRQSVLKNKRLFFLEFFINTLAQKNHITCTPIPELSEIHFRKNYTAADLQDRNKLYHPVKDVSLHEKIRARYT